MAGRVESVCCLCSFSSGVMLLAVRFELCVSRVFLILLFHWAFMLSVCGILCLGSGIM